MDVIEGPPSQDRGSVVAVVAMAMLEAGPEKPGVEGKGGEAGDKDAAAGEGEEATAGLVRIAPRLGADLDGLDQGRRLGGHLLGRTRVAAKKAG